MKKLLLAVFTISTFVAFSQVPQGINYQGIARNTGGTVLSSQAIAIKFDLHQGSAGGSIVFSENHNITTNPFGLFNLTIGSANTSAFATINWGGGPYFLETSIDPSGGASFTSLGTQQFMSVPYALYAQTSGNASPTPTITINAPNTVTGAAGSYSINVPAQTLSINSNSISISNGNTIVLPAGTTYTAGTGISVSGNTISNTAPDQPVTLNAAGATTVTGSYPSFTINTPTTQAYTAGNGIDITGGVISNTATAVTPTIVGTGATNVTSSGNTFTVNTPAPVVYTAGNGIDVTGSVITGTANITGAGATTVTGTYPNLTINTPTTQVYTAGTGIDITATGVISNTATAVTPTITGSGLASVSTPGANTFNVDVPAPSLSYNNATNVLTLTQGSAASTATLIGTGTNTTSIVGTGLATVTPTTGSTFTVSVPNPTLSLGSGSLSISGGNSVALPTQTLSGSAASLTISNGNSVPWPLHSLSINSNSLTVNGPGGNTVILPGAATTTVSSGSNISVSGSAASYTVSAPAYSLTSNSNTLTLSNGSSVTTATVPASAAAYVGTTNNITVTSNTINLATTGVSANTYGAIGSNSVPTFSVDAFGRVITATQYVPTVLGDVTGSINGATVGKLQGRSVAATLPTVNQVLTWNGAAWTPSTTSTPALTGTGTGIATVTTSINNFTVNVPSPTYNTATGVLGFGTSTVNAAPTLSLTGTTLSSGASTNSVNLSAIPGLWAASSTTAIIETNTTNNVGIGMLSPAPQFKLDVTATGANSVAIHGLSTGATDVFAGIFGENGSTGIGVYGQSNGGKGVFGKSTGASGSGIYGESDSGIGGKFLVTNTVTASNAVNVQTNGTGAALFVKSFNANRFAGDFVGDVNIGGRIRIDSTLTMGSYTIQPQVAPGNEGRIYFDRPSGKFKVSENSGAYVNLIGGASPWVQGAGTVTLSTATDKVAIGPLTPNSLLDIKNTAASSVINFPLLNIVNTNTSYNNGATGIINIDNQATTGGAAGLYINSASLGNGIMSYLTNTSSNGTGISSTVNGVGNALYLSVNNTTSNAFIVDASSSGIGGGIITKLTNSVTTGTAIEGDNYGHGSAGHFGIANTTNGSTALDATTNGGGLAFSATNSGLGNIANFSITNAINSSIGVQVTTNGTGTALYASNSNTTNGSAVIQANQVSTGVALYASNTNTSSGSTAQFDGSNGSAVLNAINSAGGIAVNANAQAGSAVYAQSSGGSSPTIYAANGGTGDAIHAFGASNGQRAINAANNSNLYPAVEVTNSGTGPSLVVNGKVRIADATQGLGKVLTSDASGNATWQTPSGGSAWGLSGNSLTGTEFLGSTNSQDVIFKSAGTELMRLKSTNAITFTAGQYSMTASTAVNPALTLTGPNFPSTQINIKATNSVTAIGNLGSISFSDGNNSTTQAYIQGMREAAGGTTADLPTALLFYTTPDGSGTEAERMRISNNGRVGIGNAAPSAMLHVQSAATTTVALLLQDGHIKSTQATAPTTTSVSVSGGGISAVAPSLTNATDAKGKLTAVITTSTMINATNNTTVRVTFNKGYTIAPTVVVTSLTDLLGLSYFVTNVTTTTFDLTIKNSTTGNITSPANWTVNFNYMVIE